MYGFINKHYGDYDNMKDQFETEAMKIQGSGWIDIYLMARLKR
jgi:superoxide dismutase